MGQTVRDLSLKAKTTPGRRVLRLLAAGSLSGPQSLVLYRIQALKPSWASEKRFFETNLRAISRRSHQACQPC